VVGDYGRRCNNRQFHHTPPGPCQHSQAGPRVACRPEHGISQHSSLQDN
jgi:hypothetical protein